MRRGEARQGGGADMQIGKPIRTIVVEPLELPVSRPTGEPEPDRAPDRDRRRGAGPFRRDELTSMSSRG